MEKNRSHMTDRILDLTLEIIYLLTGEECIIAKKTSGSQKKPNSLLSVSRRCSRKRSHKMEPSTHSLISEIKNYKKILEVTQKIIDLLTGEVSVRCQDVTVYFSMEEWEYLEGHKDLYKDVTMENRPPLTSPDGSRKRNTPERCPRPLYSRDSTEEHQEIPQEHHEIPQAHPLYSGDSTQEHQEIPKAHALYSRDSTKEHHEIPQGRPLYSRDSTQENHKIPHHNQGDCVSNMKVTQIEEKMCVNAVVQDKEKHIPTDGSISKTTQQKCLNSLNSVQEHQKVSYADQREHQLTLKAKDTERVDKFLRTDVLKQHECQLNVESEVKGKEDNNILRTDLWKEKREHQWNVKAEVKGKEDNNILRTDLWKEKHEHQWNVKAEVKGKEDNILRTNMWKEKHEHQWNVKAEVTERVEDNTFLRTEIHRNERRFNFQPEITERQENKFLRTDFWKEKREHQLNVKAEVKEKEDNTFLRTDFWKEKHEHQLNVKAEVKEKEDNTFLRTDFWKEKREQLNVKAEVTERVEDKFLRTDGNERPFNFKPEITERQENTFLRTDVQKVQREASVQTSVSRSIPKRCSSPPYQWDSTGEHQKVLQDEKGERLINIKVEEMESDDKMYMWRDPMCKEEDVSTDGSYNRNTPERSRSPLYSWDSTPENHKILLNYQDERPSRHQAGSSGAPEKSYGRGVEQRQEEQIPPEIGTDGRYTGYSMEKCPMIFPDGDMEDDVTGDSFEETPVGAIPHSPGQSPGPSTHAGNFRGHLPPVTYRASRRRGETFMCSECGECFTAKAKLFKHQRDHIVDKPHSCPDCGKCFVEKSHLVNHQRSHSVEKPYTCSLCGKCFGEKGHLANHEKSHANEKEFFCYDCGKCFTQRGHFNRHQRLHTGEKPYPCPECGKRFPHREYLIRHQRVHAGQKPFPCSECGKCFTDKYDLAKHERIHSGHRPYSCPECGRGFTQKSNLARHIRVHADYNRIHVLTVGNGSPGDPPSSTISVPTGDERFLYQDMTAE